MPKEEMEAIRSFLQLLLREAAAVVDKLITMGEQADQVEERCILGQCQTLPLQHKGIKVAFLEGLVMEAVEVAVPVVLDLTEQVMEMVGMVE